MASRQPAVEGWFAEEPEPHLIGTRCTESGSYFFPPETTMSRAPGHRDSALVEVPLSRRGTLWSYTDAGYQPPEPYIPVADPFVPFTIAAVMLEAEQMVVLGQCVEGVTPAELSVGDEMELVIDTLYEAEGIEYTTWKWRPVAAATSGGR